MLYRIDYFEENVINPITNREYDATWIIFVLNDEDYNMFCGSIHLRLVRSISIGKCLWATLLVLIPRLERI